MYFAWLGHYTTALTIPAVVGIFFWVRTSSRILFDSINLCYLKEVSKKTKIEILYYIDRFLKYVHLRVRISISISVLSIRESLSLNVSVNESLCVCSRKTKAFRWKNPIKAHRDLIITGLSKEKKEQ